MEPEVRRRVVENLPGQLLTEMAEDAIRSGTKIDVDGYLDYLGTTVIGAWTWLPEYQMGVTSEIPLNAARRLIAGNVEKTNAWIVITLLSAVATCVVMLNPRRMVRKRPSRLDVSVHYGPYEVRELIAAGGIGKVYKGYDQRLQRMVAIKVLERTGITPQMFTRFEREIRATASLQHPNTIEIFDCGHDEDGGFYYVMELIDGLDLSNLVIRYGPQNAARVIYILKQILSSLDEAHFRGLVHRDIKPSNILLSNRPGMSDFVKVFDFGLVKDCSSGCPSIKNHP